MDGSGGGHTPAVLSRLPAYLSGSKSERGDIDVARDPSSAKKPSHIHPEGEHPAARAPPEEPRRRSIAGATGCAWIGGYGRDLFPPVTAGGVCLACWRCSSMPISLSARSKRWRNWHRRSTCGGAGPSPHIRRPDSGPDEADRKLRPVSFQGVVRDRQAREWHQHGPRLGREAQYRLAVADGSADVDGPCLGGAGRRFRQPMAHQRIGDPAFYVYK